MWLKILSTYTYVFDYSTEGLLDVQSSGAVYFKFLPVNVSKIVIVLAVLCLTFLIMLF